MEPVVFFGGDHVGMKCQQETFHVSSCYGTCFFFGGDHVGMKCQQETFHVSSCYGTCFFFW